jgi:choline dehydrogenase-like flavoprotein
MIRDLLEHGERVVARAPVCVIGGGTAGLLLAARLRRASIPVVVLESGGATNSGKHPLNEVVSRGRRYDGAVTGRARCLGGTSTLWGGALLPFLPGDLEARPYLGLPAWPVPFEAIAPYLEEVEAAFGVAAGAYSEAFVTERGLARVIPTDDPDFVPRFAKWPPFKLRNVATLLRENLEGDADLAIWLNATVTRFEVDRERGRLAKVFAEAPSGRRIEVAPEHVVLSAGAIESTRLLLLLDRQHEGRIFGASSALGCYFHDHVSVRAARLVARQPAALNRMAGFRFQGQTMRSLRYELSPLAQAADGVASAFGHISFQSDAASGFDVLRDLLRSLQKRGRIDPALLVRLPRHMPYLARAGWWRAAYGQLLWPSPARYELHIVAEQVPRPDSRITLAGECDTFGCPRAAIDWRIDTCEREAIAAYARRFDAFWSRTGKGGIAGLAFDRAATDPFAELAEAAVSDIYHPGGTTRMGTDRGSAVVDADLATFELPNIYVASTSAFPSGASSNPTMMLLAFSLRLADHLARTLTVASSASSAAEVGTMGQGRRKPA